MFVQIKFKKRRARCIMKLIDLHKDIDNIKIKISSEKSVFILPGFDENIKTIYENSSPEHKYCTNFTADVYAVDGMGEIIMDIGFLKGTSFEAEVTYDDVNNFLELCDMVSADLYHMAVAITDKYGHVKKSICSAECNIMYIKNIYVEEKCRRLGIGKYLLDNINDLFYRSLNYTHHTFILSPFPQIKCGKRSLQNIEEVSYAEKKRLIDFYKKCGYKLIKDSDFMYKVQMDKISQMMGI